MFYTYYHKYFLAFVAGAAIMVAFVLLIAVTDQTDKRPQQSLIMEAEQLLDQGRYNQGLIILEKLAREEDNTAAMLVLTEEYSNENNSFYDIRKAMEYAARLKEIDKEYQPIYDRIRGQALNDWQR